MYPFCIRWFVANLLSVISASFIEISISCCTKLIERRLHIFAVPPAYYAHLAAFRARYYIEGQIFEGGSSSERGTAERIAEVRPLPRIKDNVKDVMFYC